MRKFLGSAGRNWLTELWASLSISYRLMQAYPANAFTRCSRLLTFAAYIKILCQSLLCNLHHQLFFWTHPAPIYIQYYSSWFTVNLNKHKKLLGESRPTEWLQNLKKPTIWAIGHLTVIGINCNWYHLVMCGCEWDHLPHIKTCVNLTHTFTKGHGNLWKHS